MTSTYELIVSRIPTGTIGKMLDAVHNQKLLRTLRTCAENGRIPDRDLLTAIADYTGLTMAELVAGTLADAGFVLDPPLDTQGRQLLRRINELPPDARRQLADYLTFLEGR